MLLGVVETPLVWAAGLVEGITDDPAVQWSVLGEDDVYCLGKPVHPTRLELCWGWSRSVLFALTRWVSTKVMEGMGVQDGKGFSVTVWGGLEDAIGEIERRTGTRGSAEEWLAVTKLSRH